MKNAFDSMMKGLDEVESYLAGNTKGFKVHVPAEINVKEIRNDLHMTQMKFSDCFGFSIDAVKHWEGGRRTPEAPIRAFLTVIARNPEAVIAALHPHEIAAIENRQSTHRSRPKGKTAKTHAIHG